MADPLEDGGAVPAQPAAAPAPSSAPAPSPAPQANGEGDEFDRDIAEFERARSAARPLGSPAGADEESTPPQPAMPAPTHSQEMLAVLNWALGVERDRKTERDRADGAAALASIRGEVSAEIYPNEMVGGWVRQIAEQDPRVQAAWENRHADPKTYQQALQSLGRRFAKEHGVLPDAAATEDRAAVTAAVRGASQKQPERKPPQLGNMTATEFSKYVQDNYGYDPGVA